MLSPKLSAVRSFSKFFSSSGGGKEALVEDGVPTSPPKTSSLRQQQQPSSGGGQGKGKGGSPSQNEESMASDLDFIRELTRYRGGKERTDRQDDE